MIDVGQPQLPVNPVELLSAPSGECVPMHFLGKFEAPQQDALVRPQPATEELDVAILTNSNDNPLEIFTDDVTPRVSVNLTNPTSDVLDESRTTQEMSDSPHVHGHVHPLEVPVPQPQACTSAPSRLCTSHPVIIEIFAGSARVTACLRSLGLKRCFGVDHVKIMSSGPVMVADLTTDEGMELLWTWLRSPNVLGIFAAPPCGTCSQARTIALHDARGRKLPGPKPLRSALKPNGFAHLQGQDALRVSLAMHHVLVFCHQRDMLICVENPRSSLFWLTDAWKKAPFSFTVHCASGMRIWRQTTKMDCACSQCPGH